MDILKVLVTIGSMSEKKFTRLFKIIDELCEESILDRNQVIAQVGFDNYESNYYKTFDMISDSEFKQKIIECDLIITHAGTGTIMSALKKNKKVILFPRMEKYDEHYDNHQLEISEIFKNKNLVLCATTKKELIQCISKIKSFTPGKFNSNNSYINEKIINFIEGI